MNINFSKPPFRLKRFIWIKLYLDPGRGIFHPFNNLKFFERKSNFQLSQSGLKAPVHVYLD